MDDERRGRDDDPERGHRQVTPRRQSSELAHDEFEIVSRSARIGSRLAVGSMEAIMEKVPWNKGRLTGQKRPLKPNDVWAIRMRLQLEHERGI